MTLGQLQNELSVKARYVISGLILAALILNWVPQVDILASEYLADTISSNAIVYGVVRTLNGVISVAQSAEVGVGVASVGLGEILDPVNDLIERFSTLLLVTLTALGISNVLLILSSSFAFKVLVTLVGFVAMGMLWMKSHQISYGLRIIIALLILRFVLVLQIGFVWLFDRLYFDATGEQALSVLQATINFVESLKESFTSFSIADLAFGDTPTIDTGDVGENIATSVVTLSVGMLFKSILIPIGTLWLSYKAVARLI